MVGQVKKEETPNLQENSVAEEPNLKLISRFFNTETLGPALDIILKHLSLRDVKAILCLSKNHTWQDRAFVRILSQDIFEIDFHLLSEKSAAFVESLINQTIEDRKTLICQRANLVGQELYETLKLKAPYAQFEETLSKETFGSNQAAFARHLLQFHEFAILSEVPINMAYSTYSLLRKEIKVLVFRDGSYFSHTQTMNGKYLVLMPPEFAMKDPYLVINLKGTALRTLPTKITQCRELQSLDVTGTHITFDSLTTNQKEWIYHLIHENIAKPESFKGIELPEHFIPRERSVLEILDAQCNQIMNSQFYQKTRGTCSVM